MIIWKLSMRRREKVGVGIALTFGILSVLRERFPSFTTDDALVPPLQLQPNATGCSGLAARIALVSYVQPKIREEC